MSYDSPYKSPQAMEAKIPPGARPPHWWLFQLYCGYMVFLYVGLALLGVFLLSISPQLNGEDRFEATLWGAMLIIVSLPFAVLFVFGFFLPKRPWAFGVSMALICLGLTGCAAWPFAIPLLIFWLKPETKQYFA